MFVIVVEEEDFSNAIHNHVEYIHVCVCVCLGKYYYIFIERTQTNHLQLQLNQRICIVDIFIVVCFSRVFSQIENVDYTRSIDRETIDASIQCFTATTYDAIHKPLRNSLTPQLNNMHRLINTHGNRLQFKFRKIRIKRAKKKL